MCIWKKEAGDWDLRWFLKGHLCGSWFLVIFDFKFCNFAAVGKRSLKSASQSIKHLIKQTVCLRYNNSSGSLHIHSQTYQKLKNSPTFSLEVPGAMLDTMTAVDMVQRWVESARRINLKWEQWEGEEVQETKRERERYPSPIYTGSSAVHQDMLCTV